MISCILPTYNRPSETYDRIVELRNQTIAHLLEIIVVNDGSYLDYSKIESIKDIKYIKLEYNSGSVSIPRAIGISHSTMPYIAHIDDDVFNFTYKMELLLNHITRTDTLLCYGARITKELNGIEQISYTQPLWDPRETWGVDGGQFIYKNIYNKIPYIFCRRACDYETAKAIAMYDYSFSSIPNVVCNYIWHGKNRSLDPLTKERKIYPRSFEKYFKNLTYKLPIEI